ncbi:hypothetical protein [Nocardia lijiangensis]|uniref:hypothetical protein n=1 Tax=Nocardia lijiangensis TaxID=299618 RepID=UPI00082CDA13|nr:hypothetical protein [Nocardia lijiangensis]
MSISFVSSGRIADPPEAEYRPEHEFVYGGGKYTANAAAKVGVFFGSDLTLWLHIDDARVLVAEVAAALAEHDALAYRVDLVKAAA